MKVLPKEHRIRYNIQIIRLGREICRAPVPKCNLCFPAGCCPFYEKETEESGGTGKRTGRKTAGRVKDV
ncbi:MAG: hypothetical protein HFI91_05980 [Lachnospiraceae bacterium]|nr:hypothetical protein [Lachnospiraceae bacterium]